MITIMSGLNYTRVYYKDDKASLEMLPVGLTFVDWFGNQLSDADDIVTSTIQRIDSSCFTGEMGYITGSCRRYSMSRISVPL